MFVVAEIMLIYMKYLHANSKTYPGSFVNTRTNHCIFIVRVFL